MCGEQIKPAQGCLNSGISYLIHVWCLNLRSLAFNRCFENIISTYTDSSCRTKSPCKAFLTAISFPQSRV